MAWAKGGLLLLAALLRGVRICTAECQAALEMCMSTYDTAALGRGPELLCPSFATFSNCFYGAFPSCTATQATQYSAKYAEMKATLLTEAPTCQVITTPGPPVDLVEEASSSGSFEWQWHWGIFGIIAAFCCICALVGVCMRRRKDRYYQGDPYGNEVYEDDYEFGGMPMRFQQGPGGMYPGVNLPPPGPPGFGQSFGGPPPGAGGYGGGPYGGSMSPRGGPYGGPPPGYGGGFDYNSATMPTRYDMGGSGYME